MTLAFSFWRRRTHKNSLHWHIGEHDWNVGRCNPQRARREAIYVGVPAKLLDGSGD